MLRCRVSRINDVHNGSIRRWQDILTESTQRSHRTQRWSETDRIDTSERQIPNQSKAVFTLCLVRDARRYHLCILHCTGGNTLRSKTQTQYIYTWARKTHWKDNQRPWSTGRVRDTCWISDEEDYFRRWTEEGSDRSWTNYGSIDGLARWANVRPR